MGNRNNQVNVLVASYLTPDEVERIRASVPPGIRIVYEPELLPVPQYTSDHYGVQRSLTQQQMAQWRSLLEAAEVLFDFDWWRPSELRANAPRLRWVQATSSGIGQVLIDTGLDKTDITFTTAAGVHAIPLAEHVVLGLLWLAKDVPELLKRQREHYWQRFTTNLLHGRRILLVGLGSVGRQIATVCEGLGVEVWACRRTAGGDVAGVSRIVAVDDIHRVLPEVDALVLACPHTTETEGLIGQRELAAMKPGAGIVNVARGPVIDEVAMVRALRSGALGGAVLDVFAIEPLPADSPLWEFENVLISPHSASTVAEENDRIVDIFIENLRRYATDEPLVNVFAREQGY